uniref:Uncharacterized protein n=1 Tax=Streptomyces sp. NBC_00003 TaxID=2903608 RepID=A0AAU2VGS8_9ACTN
MAAARNQRRAALRLDSGRGEALGPEAVAGSVMVTPEEAPCPVVEIVQVDDTSSDLLAVVVRCLATTRLGARFRCVSQHGRAVDLILTEIRRYPHVTATDVDPPHGALLVFTGAGADELQLKARDVLRGTNPVA